MRWYLDHLMKSPTGSPRLVRVGTSDWRACARLCSIRSLQRRWMMYLRKLYRSGATPPGRHAVALADLILKDRLQVRNRRPQQRCLALDVLDTVLWWPARGVTDMIRSKKLVDGGVVALAEDLLVQTPRPQLVSAEIHHAWTAPR